MSYTKITSRIAAAILAGALSIGGLMSIGAVVADDHQVDAPAEETAARWSLTIAIGGKGGAGTHGATWS